MAVSSRGLGVVSGQSPTSHLTFLQALCSALHRWFCRGSSESESAPLGGSARPGLSSASSFGVGSGMGQSPGVRPGVARSSPLSHSAPPVRILTDLGRPGRRSGSCTGHLLRTCCFAGFRCSVFLIVLSISHSYLVVFMCDAWDFGALSGYFAGCGRSSL
ncbi:hypothetical protein NDU88_005667 [Pleurodeles waltl]|uniref:Uncharacterized protein n=1 Tax=Pleurodeles waltl TaxID=8319 RepID=A0AAV7SMB9_PLEWA|nr:hypothetical protein NDU88_005667 [Pleurodeles waltl]